MVAAKELPSSLPETPGIKIHRDFVPFSPQTWNRILGMRGDLRALAEQGLAPDLVGLSTLSRNPKEIGIATVQPARASTLANRGELGDKLYTPSFARMVTGMASGLYENGVFYARFAPESILYVPGDGPEPDRCMPQRIAFLHKNEGGFRPSHFVHQIAETLARIYFGAHTDQLLRYAYQTDRPTADQIKDMMLPLLRAEKGFNRFLDPQAVSPDVINAMANGLLYRDDQELPFPLLSESQTPPIRLAA